MKDKKSTRIDELLQIRQNGILDYSRATKELIDIGVKIGRESDGAITIPSSFQPFLESYEISNLEFEWEAEYIDGSKIKQFAGEVQHNFSDIDQSRLKTISFISNFVWGTDMAEKRIIVKLNWQTGLFEVLNGQMTLEARNFAFMNPLIGEKQLILFCRKGQSATVGEVSDSIKEFMPETSEVFYYNRFVLGYKIPGGEKKALIIYPNGEIDIFYD